MDDKLSGSTDTFKDDGVDIPEYVDYFSLLYRLASTVFVVGMGSLIISTILQYRSLHNVHNILIINLMVADIINIVLYAFHNIGMTVSYIIGKQDPFRCEVFQFFLFPVVVVMYTFVMLSVEKFIAIKYALRHRAIVTHRRVYQAIAAGWIIAVLLRLIKLVYELIVGVEYDKLSQVGLCLQKRVAIIDLLFGLTIPIFLAFFITIPIDVYLSIKAYQVYKRIQKENRENKQASEDKLNKILKQLKPLITLLVTILGSSTIAFIAAIIYHYSSITAGQPLLVTHVILPNVGYLDMSLHVMVYGLYFRKIRQPLCRRLKRMVQSFKFNKKSNVVLPTQGYHDRSTRIAWM